MDATVMSDVEVPEFELIDRMPDSGFENGVVAWKGGVVLESSHVANGSKAGRFNGAFFYKAYSTLQPIDGDRYYQLSLKAAIENVSVSPAIWLRFFAADGQTRVGGADNIFDCQGSAPYREFTGDFIYAPADAAFVQINVSFPKGNKGAKLYLDDVHFYECPNLPVRLVPTYESMSVYVGRHAPVDRETARFYYRVSGQSAWQEALDPIYDSDEGEYRGSIIGLDEGVAYEVKVLLEVDGTTLEEGFATAQTWTSTPPIARELSVADLYSDGQLLIDSMHGEPDAWIRISGTGGRDIDAAYGDDVALLIRNSSYLIFENIGIAGGRRHAVQVNMSQHIRVINCEMSGWGRTPNFTDGKHYYESEAEMKARGSINKDAGVHLYLSSAVTVERCYIHDPRSSANNWSHGHPEGPTAIYVQNLEGERKRVMKGNMVVRYNDLIGSDGIRWNDVIEGENNGSRYGSFYRDSDIYGNMLVFANDDGTEMDGGQMNTRFYGNRIENCFVGLSLAPCLTGPSYVFRNLMTHMGDERGSCWSVVKLGGGDTYSKGKSFFFHNTLYSHGNGITGVGFGSDENRSLFLAMTRNNIIRSLGTAADYSRTIVDKEKARWNNFDYDNLSSRGAVSAHVDYAEGQELHGILDDGPEFVDAAAGDFRLAEGSSAIDAAIALPNFSGSFSGKAPDQGAIECGTGSLFPLRPIEINSDKYFVDLVAHEDGLSDPVELTLRAGALAGSLRYTVRMNETVDWLSVTPAEGAISENSSKSFRFELHANGRPPSRTLKATVLIRFENGLSVPITVRAANQN